MSKYFVESTKESVKDIFKKRLLFKIVSRSKYPSLVDFRFAEKALYGRVNRLYQPMVLNENHLQLEYLSSGNPAGIQAFDFVADAFRDLQNKFKLQVASGQLDANDNYLTDIIPMAGYKSPKNLYDNYASSYSVAIGNIIKKKNLKFTTFEQFINLVMPYIRNTIKNNKVFTYPAFIKSKDCPIHVSGLVVDIAIIKPNDDNFKYENFYQSKNWDFFLNACNTYGFMVDCNMPNRIVADIGSAAMVDKMRQRNPMISSTNIFLESCYDFLAFEDFVQFKKFLFRLYKDNKRATILTTTHTKSDGTRAVVRAVKSYTYEQFLSEYGNEYFLKLFCEIRFLEEESKFAYHEKNSLIENTIELSRVDFVAAVQVFEEILNKTFDYSGSLSYIRNRNRILGR
jgi:hypothetical protein